MPHRTQRPTSWPILTLLGTAVLSAQACDGGRDLTLVQATGGSSLGGASLAGGSEGSAMGGGSGTTMGGARSDSGRISAAQSNTLGDAGTPSTPARAGAGDTAVAGAAGDSQTPGAAGSLQVGCTSDKQCQALGQLCDTVDQLCVDCFSKEQCDDGELCIDHECRSGNPCTTRAQCADAPQGRTVCDMGRGECVECLEASDCGDDNDCIDRHCVPYIPCEDSRDCPAGEQVCSTASGRCVDCNTDADCLNEALPVCAPDGTCHAVCSIADADCSNVGGVCDRSEGYCVECRNDADCPASKHCRSAVCVADLCSPGDTTCVGNGVAACNEAGNAFGQAVPCSSGQTCTALLSRAICGTLGQGGATGESGEGGAQPEGGAGGQGGTPACATGAAPCKRIPELMGTQLVDGYDSEFCDVPSFVLDFGSHNAKVEDWNHQAPYTESALVHVAWSASALHVFVTVHDSTVNPWQNGDNLWDGDGIEVMVTTTADVSGNVGGDGRALHVAASYEKAVSVVDNVTTDLPSGEHAGRTIAGGYTIELQLPWPQGGESLVSGSEIRFNVTLNAANAQQGDTWRDAQAILSMGPPNQSFDDSPCGSEIQPYCDDRAWCRTQLE